MLYAWKKTFSGAAFASFFLSALRTRVWPNPRFFFTQILFNKHEWTFKHTDNLGALSFSAQLWGIACKRKKKVITLALPFDCSFLPSRTHIQERKGTLTSCSVVRTLVTLLAPWILVLFFSRIVRSEVPSPFSLSLLASCLLLPCVSSLATSTRINTQQREVIIICCSRIHSSLSLSISHEYRAKRNFNTPLCVVAARAGVISFRFFYHFELLLFFFLTRFLSFRRISFCCFVCPSTSVVTSRTCLFFLLFFSAKYCSSIYTHTHSHLHTTPG